MIVGLIDEFRHRVCKSVRDHDRAMETANWVVFNANFLNRQADAPTLELVEAIEVDGIRFNAGLIGINELSLQIDQVAERLGA